MRGTVGLSARLGKRPWRASPYVKARGVTDGGGEGVRGIFVPGV